MSDPETEQLYESATELQRRILVRLYRQTPEWHGKILWPKAGGPDAMCVPMPFSCTLIEQAGGMKNLRDHWEIEP